MSGRVGVTGGCGFIGGHLVNALSERGYEVVVYDDLSSGSLENIEGLAHVQHVRGDIRDGELLAASLKGCSKVFHLAAEISVARSVENPVLTEQVNTQGTINLLEAARIHGIGSVVFASSAAVYGNGDNAPRKESSPLEPVSPYAISKLSGEYYMAMYAKLYGIRTVVTRFFNVFGERQRLGSGYAAAIPIFITKALSNDSLTIYGDGAQTRDFIYIKDLIQYLLVLSDRGEGIYNIGYGKSITINALAERIVALSQSCSEILHAVPRAGDVRHSLADVTRIREIGAALTGFDRGLAATIAYFQSLRLH